MRPVRGPVTQKINITFLGEVSILIDNWPCSIDTYRYFPSLFPSYVPHPVSFPSLILSLCTPRSCLVFVMLRSLDVCSPYPVGTHSWLRELIRISEGRRAYNSKKNYVKKHQKLIHLFQAGDGLWVPIRFLEISETEKVFFLKFWKINKHFRKFRGSPLKKIYGILRKFLKII